MKKLWNFTAEKSSRDPDVIYYNEKYYAVYAGKDNSIGISVSFLPEELADAEVITVYKAEKGKAYSEQLWAPELHVIDGKCYIYVACDDGDNHTHRMYVLENGSDDPTAPYRLAGKIGDGTDKWAIDGTVISHDGKNYFVWSGWQGDENVCQDLYIAEMESPLKLKGERHLISTPDREWEKLGATGESESPFINEGPYGVHFDGELYLLYSGSGSWCEDYCIAYLKLTGDDPLKRECWTKCEKPIISRTKDIKGAGHPSVVDHGDKKLIFFHAWEDEENIILWNRVFAFMGILEKRDGELFIS